MTSSTPALDARRPLGSLPGAVLLDMDGTLVDTEGFWWDAEVEVFGALGHVLDEEHRAVVVGGPMTRSAGYLIEVTGADITLDEVRDLLNTAFLRRLDGGVPLMPGARRLLTELAAHRVPTALVSASHREVIDRTLRSLGAEFFGTTVAGDELARTKPHPDPYVTAALRLGAEPARCVAVEDTATGVASAEAAGCRVLAVPSVAPIPPAAGRTVVDSLESVDLAFLRGLVSGPAEPSEPGPEEDLAGKRA
ncbi:haloacid dehalogenase superfamily, subfamily IA, variant 3 with third motif having DD or ED [Streptomyces zhaozhouensis]|uniref:Haloacid dehalogenase superfamily, subfamily IA, variant 3 with third motif having DD or ED n=1 Tax=Streptomyces zhaozhouensis TaxID=1300267 RepID=A0A286DS66_9ACTN|nr:HAD family phosphatase [Streptomyces zhaozhouensis]SOD61512.1 haloacid dehalogenase superfamily, subfamily IA, variant 3 with third motif having DD or ED [Streptomyces zhaozhouensis]